VAVLGLCQSSAADPGSKKAALPQDGPSLLEFFRKRIPTAADQKKIKGLIELLGDDEFEVRRKATEDLAAIGPVAVPFLQRALRDDDPEVVDRAKTALAQIENENAPTLVAAAAGLLAKKKPAGGAAVLLAYLPFTRDEAAAEAVQSALVALAMPAGKAEPVLVKALQDKLAVKRIAAALALLKGGPVGLRKDLRPLLADKEPLVRFHVAMGFVEAKDKDAVPVLIALLGRLPRDQENDIEELLYRCAGDQVPKKIQEGDLTGAQARDAWDGWWREHGRKLDLAKLDSSKGMQGYTLLAMMDQIRGGYKVLEIDRKGKTRWEITGLINVKDAQVVGPNRVLIAEYSQRRITERDFKGKILWEKAVPTLLVGCQRLPNGNTLVVTRRQILEMDKTGKTVFTYTNRTGSIICARQTRDGQIVFLASAGTLTWVDKKGQVKKTLQVGSVYPIGSGFDVLPNGRVVVPDYARNKVLEYDASGKVVWQAAAQRPTSAQRLPNGNTLVASSMTGQIVELDRKGKEVWKHTVAGRVIRAWRR
jgi:hypothetical protein